MPVVNARAINCEDGPLIGQRVRDGTGTCVSWGPEDNEYDCCYFCRSLRGATRSIASQYIRPEVHAAHQNPFTGQAYNGAACCCFYTGVFEDIDYQDDTIFFSY